MGSVSTESVLLHSAECVAKLLELKVALGEWRDTLMWAHPSREGSNDSMEQAGKAAIQQIVDTIKAGDGDMMENGFTLSKAGAKNVNTWVARMYVQLTSTNSKPSGAFVQGTGKNVLDGAKALATGSVAVCCGGTLAKGLRKVILESADAILESTERFFDQFATAKVEDGVPSDIIVSEVFNKCDCFPLVPSNNMEWSLQVLAENDSLLEDAMGEVRELLSQEPAEQDENEVNEEGGGDAEDDFDDFFGEDGLDSEGHVRGQRALKLITECRKVLAAVRDAAGKAKDSQRSNEIVSSSGWEGVSTSVRKLSETSDILCTSLDDDDAFSQSSKDLLKAVGRVSSQIKSIVEGEDATDSDKQLVAPVTEAYRQLVQLSLAEQQSQS